VPVAAAAVAAVAAAVAVTITITNGSSTAAEEARTRAGGVPPLAGVLDVCAEADQEPRVRDVGRCVSYVFIFIIYYLFIMEFSRC